MKLYRAELHVHTVLSPCAEIEMLPPLIVQEALQKDIGILAITDHNATANIPAVQAAAEGTGLHILAGMELQTREEVHALCLFDTFEQSQQFQSLVNAHLPQQQNAPDYFGIQLVVDREGELIREEKQLLLTSTSLSLVQAWEQVNALGGLFIPAHINRKAFGLIETLGFVPEDLPVEALEISSHISPEEARKRFPQITGYTLIHSGDAHRLDEILGLNQFFIEAPSISEIRKAIQGHEARTIQLLPLSA